MSRSAARTEPGPCSSTTRTVVRDESIPVLEALIEDTMNCLSKEVAWRRASTMAVAASPKTKATCGQPTPRSRPLQQDGTGDARTLTQLRGAAYNRQRVGQGVAARRQLRASVAQLVNGRINRRTREDECEPSS